MNRLSRLASMHIVKLLDPETPAVVSREKARQSHAARRSRSKSKDRLGGARSKSPAHMLRDAIPRSMSPSRISDMWKRAAGAALRWSRGHYRDNLRISGREHMSDVDCFDGAKVRKGRFEREEKVWDPRKDQRKREEDVELTGLEEDLVTIFPVVDGRLKDEGRK